MASITPLEDRPRNKCRYWRLFCSLGKTSKGKRIQKSKRFRGTYAEAKKAAVEFENECKHNYISEEVELGVYLERWQEKRKDKMRASTIAKDKQNIRTIKWLFGEHTHLSELTPEVIDDAFQELLTKGGPSGHKIGTSYAGHLKSSLAGMLKDARKEGYIMHDPIPDTERISKRTPERENIPSAAEVKALLDSLDCRDGRQMCVFLCASLGLRRAESLGLRWKDVDFENNLIHIRGALQYDGTIGDPKTRESRRILPMPSYLKEALEIRQMAAKADIKVARKNGTTKQETPWDDTVVCCNERGEILSLSAASHWWNKHRKTFGMKCGLHGLRHALLTNMASSGVPVHSMMKIAGHSSPNTTLRIYLHSCMDDKLDAFDAIFDAVAPEGEKGGDDATEQ